MAETTERAITPESVSKHVDYLRAVLLHKGDTAAAAEALELDFRCVSHWRRRYPLFAEIESVFSGLGKLDPDGALAAAMKHCRTAAYATGGRLRRKHARHYLAGLAFMATTPLEAVA